jgi:hypothetical protein
MWRGDTDDCGYGVIYFKGKLWKANRLALVQKLGRPIRQKLYALHTCHRPSCVNPDHLYEGTQKSNMKDMYVARRRVVMRGDIHPSSRFTEKQLSDIAADPRKPRFIMREYGIGKTHLRRVKNGTARSKSIDPNTTYLTS